MSYLIDKPFICPDCNEVLSGMEPIERDCQRHELGDIIFCLNCGAMLAIREENTVSKIGEAELEIAYLEQPELRHVLPAAQREVNRIVLMSRLMKQNKNPHNDEFYNN